MPVQPPNASSSKPPPRLERVGRYELIVELARGPLGPLWAARIASGAEVGRLVSVRRVRVAGRGELSSRLTAATLAAMEVRHPKIVAVLDVTLAGDELAVVSEYIDGEVLYSLQRLAFLNGAYLPPAIALRVASDLITSLTMARETWQTRGIRGGEPFAHYLYGGLGPHSIVVASYGDVMLADLGVSAAAAQFPEFSENVELLAYRAPEQLDADDPPDERSDVFSVGVLLWELIANRSLFGTSGRARASEPTSLGAQKPNLGSDIAAIKAKLRTLPIRRLDDIGDQAKPVRGAIADLVARALERAPNARFQSLHEMEASLRSLPRDAIATPDQLSGAVDRLARSVIDARRRAIERVVGKQSAPPGSTRPTKRPVPTDTRAPRTPLVDVAQPDAAELPRKPLGAPAIPPPPPVRTRRPEHVLKPDAIVAVGPLPRAEAERSAPLEPQTSQAEALRAAFAAAREAELAAQREGGYARPLPIAPAAAVMALDVVGAEPSTNLLRRVASAWTHANPQQRARSVAIGIAAVICAIMLMAAVRALFADKGAGDDAAPRPNGSAAPTGTGK